jgi:GNAT superfamily N-acetyltransferase
VSRRLVNLTLDNIGDLPPRCHDCVYWELDQVSADRACAGGDSALEKEAWLSDTLLEWGTCGFLAYVNDQPAGYVLYAPPAYVPRSLGFPTSPISPDSVLLVTGRVESRYAGGGLGRMLVQAVARDAARRGVRAIEAFARTGDDDRSRRGTALGCLVPADYLQAVGFAVVREHPTTPRLRMDVKTALSWREEVEYAIDRLLSSASALAHR